MFETKAAKLVYEHGIAKWFQFETVESESNQRAKFYWRIEKQTSHIDEKKAIGKCTNLGLQGALFMKHIETDFGV